MKKLLVTLMIALTAFAAVPAVAYADDSVIDKMGDWFATVGKSPEEKDRVLAERKLERASKRFSDAVNKSAKKTEKGLEEAGKDLERAFKS